MIHPKVEEYINKQPSPHKEILIKLRKLILKTLPKTSEDFMWGVPVYEGGKFYLAGLKKQVNIGFAINGLNQQELALFEGSGKTMRHIKIHTVKAINRKELVKLIKLVQQKSECAGC